MAKIGKRKNKENMVLLKLFKGKYNVNELPYNFTLRGYKDTIYELERDIKLFKEQEERNNPIIKKK